MTVNIKKYSLLFFFFFLLFSSCKKENDTINIQEYYFPMEELKDGLMYKYKATRDSVPDDYWLYKSLETDSATYLLTTGYNLESSPTQFSRSEVVHNGVILANLRLMDYDTLGEVQFTDVNIVEKNMFPFEVKDSTDIFLYEIEFSEPLVPTQKVTLLRNRIFKGKTTFEWQGKMMDCVEFQVLERAKILYDDGQISQNAYKKELYAKGIGLIYYSKTLEDGFFREYVLAERTPME